MPTPRLILASASPRRRELLHAAGYDFEVHPSDVDEDKQPAQILPADLALRLAQLKANAVAERFPDDVVLAADTVVAFGDWALGKPANDAAAIKMIELLSGTTHIVITGIVVIRKSSGIIRSDRVMSAVRMKMLSMSEIRRYVESGLWQGKAGGYGIQDERDDPFVACMVGSHSNVVGLPMEKTTEFLTGVGIMPPRPKAPASIAPTLDAGEPMPPSQTGPTSPPPPTMQPPDPPAPPAPPAPEARPPNQPWDKLL